MIGRREEIFATIVPGVLLVAAVLMVVRLGLHSLAVLQVVDPL